VLTQVLGQALDQPELSPRKLAVSFTDTRGQFISEASVYRLLRAHGLLTTPTFIMMKAADEFRDQTTAPNQLWQTDFSYLKVISWGWFYQSTVLDEGSDLQAQIAAFVEHYNHRRYHESLNNLTPADVYFGRGQSILQRRETIKHQTIEQRRLLHLKTAA
jgi:hypothetical protein